MVTEVKSLEEYNRIVTDSAATLAYFSSNDCGVCSILKPKVFEMMQRAYPQIKLIHINMVETPEIHGQLRIFAAPAIVVYFEGNETFRKSRGISVSELESMLEKTYRLLFDS